MKHVIIGKTGQLGSFIYKYLNGSNDQVLEHNVDLRKKETILNLKEKAPDVIWVAGAFTNVDKAEGDDYELAYDVNVNGIKRLVSVFGNQSKKPIIANTGQPCAQQGCRHANDPHACVCHAYVGGAPLGFAEFHSHQNAGNDDGPQGNSQQGEGQIVPLCLLG